jgi:hypothetical protein
MDGFNKRDLVLYQLKWMAIYFGSAFVVMILLPFPIDWAVAIPVFLLISLFRRRLLLRKLGVSYKKDFVNSDFKSIKNFFKSISSSTADSTLYGHQRIKYYCMRCGTEHKDIACPKCGCKMKRIG